MSTGSAPARYALKPCDGGWQVIDTATQQPLRDHLKKVRVHNRQSVAQATADFLNTKAETDGEDRFHKAYENR